MNNNTTTEMSVALNFAYIKKNITPKIPANINCIYCAIPYEPSPITSLKSSTSR